MATKSPPPSSTEKQRDFLSHLEAYLAKRDGVDKLLKISRYATKIILASSALPQTLNPLTPRLKSFEASVGVSRKAFRLGKFVQDLNALRNSRLESTLEIALATVAYGGEGVYFFVEQFVWLVKAGLIDKRFSNRLQKISAWAELIGYVGSISLKFRDVSRIVEEEAAIRGNGRREEEAKLKELQAKMLMKNLSIVQDFADGLMAVADIRDGTGRLSGPLLISCAGLVSALISTHKNWISC